MDPFIDFLETGVNKMTGGSFLKMYNRVVLECDDLDHPEQMYSYCKDIIRGFIVDKILVVVKQHEYAGLIENYAKWWNHFMLFTHTINKGFSYINENLLDDEDARKIPEECLLMFR